MGKYNDEDLQNLIDEVGDSLFNIRRAIQGKGVPGVNDYTKLADLAEKIDEIPAGVIYPPESEGGLGIRIYADADDFSYNSLNSFLREHPEIMYVMVDEFTITDSIRFSTLSGDGVDTSTVYNIIRGINPDVSGYDKFGKSKQIRFPMISQGTPFSYKDYKFIKDTVDDLQAKGWQITGNNGSENVYLPSYLSASGMVDWSGIYYPDGIGTLGIYVNPWEGDFTYDLLNDFLSEHPEITSVQINDTITGSITFFPESEVNTATILGIVEQLDGNGAGKHIRFPSNFTGLLFGNEDMNALTEIVNDATENGWEITAWDGNEYHNLLDWIVINGYNDASILGPVSVDITENGTTRIYPSNYGLDAFDTVEVNVNVSGGGDSYSYFDGSVDEDGLRAIGWTEDDIKYFRDNSPHYSWQDEELQVSEENKEIVIPYPNTYPYNYKTNPDLKFFPKIIINRGDRIEQWFNAITSVIAFPEIDASLSLYVDRLFSGNESLKVAPMLKMPENSLDLSFSGMFQNCKSLTSLPLYDTSKGTDFSKMFASCSNLGSIPPLDTHNGTDFSEMFYYCSNLGSIPPLDTSNGTNFTSMFRNCSRLLTSIPPLDTHNGTDFSQMFASCSSLISVPSLNTSQGTNFSNMFASCSSLISVPSLNTSQGTNFYSMFASCSNLISIPSLNTSQGTSFTSMFAGCTKLQRVEGIDFSGATSALPTNMWPSSNTTLTYLRVNGSVNVGWDLSNLRGLDFDSYLSCLEAASRTTNTNAKTLKFYSKTVADQDGQLAALKADCESKGWQISGLSIS